MSTMREKLKQLETTITVLKKTPLMQKAQIAEQAVDLTIDVLRELAERLHRVEVKTGSENGA